MKKALIFTALAACCLTLTACSKNADTDGCAGGGAACSEKSAAGGKCCGKCQDKQQDASPSMMGEKSSCSEKKACGSSCGSKSN